MSLRLKRQNVVSLTTEDLRLAFHARPQVSSQECTLWAARVPSVEEKSHEEPCFDSCPGSSSCIHHVCLCRRYRGRLPEGWRNVGCQDQNLLKQILASAFLCSTVVRARLCW